MYKLGEFCSQLREGSFQEGALMSLATEFRHSTDIFSPSSQPPFINIYNFFSAWGYQELGKFYHMFL